MTLSSIEIFANEIDNLVSFHMTDLVEEIKPIYDGIINPDQFINSTYKILWILKEPYDKDTEGGWDFKKTLSLKKKITDFDTGRSTFKPIIYSSWGILNNFCLFDDMNNIEVQPSMVEILNSIAYINVKKTPGGTTSDNRTIQRDYDTHKEIILKQIGYIDADIIIGCRTLHHLIDDLSIKKKDGIRYGSLTYFISNDKLYIDTYHPAQRTSSTNVTQEQYCDNIIQVAKIWAATKQGNSI
jgi:hypothetical protein